MPSSACLRIGFQQFADQRFEWIQFAGALSAHRRRRHFAGQPLVHGPPAQMQEAGNPAYGPTFEEPQAENFVQLLVVDWHRRRLYRTLLLQSIRMLFTSPSATPCRGPEYQGDAGLGSAELFFTSMVPAGAIR